MSGLYKPKPDHDICFSNLDVNRLVTRLNSHPYQEQWNLCYGGWGGRGLPTVQDGAGCPAKLISMGLPVFSRIIMYKSSSLMYIN